MDRITKHRGELKLTAKKRGGFAVWFQREGKSKFNPIAQFSSKSDELSGATGTMTFINGVPASFELEDGTLIFGKVVSVQIPGVNEVPMVGSEIMDSFSPTHTRLPRSTKEAMAKCYSIDNFHLKFNKGARWDTAPSSEGNSEDKFQLIGADQGKLNYLLHADFGHSNFKALAARTTKSAKALGFGNESSPLITLQVAPQWRWIVGLGNASVYENGMTLHHIYGFPYIPGSSIKGMLRTWMIQECFDFSEPKALENPIFRHLFGHGKLSDQEETKVPEKAGKIGAIVFFDAFPTEPVQVEPDIINNHFQDYYEGNAPPADWLMPNPVFFMTAVGGKLEFNLGLSNDPIIGDHAAPFLEKFKSQLSPASKLSELVRLWFVDALQYAGIGAKTAVGYGRMITLK